MSSAARYLALELQRREDAAKLARILVGTDEPAEPHVRPSARGGDWQRVRGVPCVGPGIGGTSPGTDPVRALARERATALVRLLRNGRASYVRLDDQTHIGKLNLRG
jgi:hypothetical protein